MGFNQTTCRVCNTDILARGDEVVMICGHCANIIIKYYCNGKLSNIKCGVFDMHHLKLKGACDRCCAENIEKFRKMVKVEAIL